MAIRFHSLPLDVFDEPARPYIQRLNMELRDLFGLEGTIRQPLVTKRSDATVTRRSEQQVHVTRITPGISTGSWEGLVDGGVAGDLLHWNGSDWEATQAGLVGAYTITNTTDPQFKIAYDGSEYWSFAVDSGGHLTMGGAGAATRNLTVENGKVIIQSTDGTGSDSTLQFNEGQTGTSQWQITIDESSGNKLRFYDDNNDTFHMTLEQSGDLGIGTTDPSVRLHVVDTAEQLRLAYGASDYLSVTQADGGTCTFDITTDGTALFSFADDVAIQSQNELRFYDNGNYVGFEAPALAADQIWVLPDADGSADDFLQTDGGGNLTWTAVPATNPGGNDTEVQFNDGGAFGGDSLFTYDKSTDILTLGGSTTNATLKVLNGGAKIKYIGVGGASPNASIPFWNAGKANLGVRCSIGTSPNNSYGLRILLNNTSTASIYGVFGSGNMSGTTTGKLIGMLFLGGLTNKGTSSELYGVQSQVSLQFNSNTKTLGGVYGGEFKATAGATNNNITLTSGCSFVGGFFRAYIDPISNDAIVIDTAEAGRFSLSLGGTNNVFTNAISVHVISPARPTGADSAFTSCYGVKLDALATTPDITNYYGIHIGDQTDVSITNNYAGYIDAQDGANKGAAVGNWYFAGDGFDEGHLQLGATHIWPNGADILFKASAPTADGDGVLSVGTVVKAGDTDGTDYAQFAADGELNLFGTARVKREFAILAVSLAPGSTGPDAVIEGNSIGYSYDIGDDSVMNFEIPYDADTSEDLKIEIYWYIDEAYATNSGEVQWQITWSACPVDGTEAIDAPTHTGTIDFGDQNIPATAKFLTEVSGTIAAASISDADFISMTLERVALDGGSNPTADPVVVQIEVEYTSNKLGEAT